jgi:phosphoserine phosphatase
MSNNRLHIHVSGYDRPGILSKVVENSIQFNWKVVDIKMFVFNDMLNLSLLMENSNSGNSEELKKSLDEYGNSSDIKINYSDPGKGLVEGSEYGHRHVVTVLGKNIDSTALMEFTQTVAELDINILRIEQLDSGDYHVLEFVIGMRDDLPSSELMSRLVQFKENRGVDIAIQEDTMFRRNKRLIVMDADMTFLQCEVIDEMGKLAGVEDEMKAITQKAMAGKMDFEEALRTRVSLLKGLPISELEKLRENIPLTPGAKILVKILKHLGYKVAIVSGGFQFFIDHLKDRYSLDYGFSNELGIEDGKLTGEVKGEIIDAKTKEKKLAMLAEKEGFSLKQVVAVGDGANDIYMLAKAGLGIAFNAKPIVQQHVSASINISNLELILYFLGISGKELQELRGIVS